MKRLSLCCLLLASISLSVNAKERPTIKPIKLDTQVTANELGASCFMSRYGVMLDSPTWFKSEDEIRAAFDNKKLCEAIVTTAAIALQDTTKVMEMYVGRATPFINCFKREAKQLELDPHSSFAKAVASSPVENRGHRDIPQSIAYFESKRHISSLCEAN